MVRRITILYIFITIINLFLFLQHYFYDNKCIVKVHKCFPSFSQNEIEKVGILDQIKFEVIDLEKEREIYVSQIAILKQKYSRYSKFIYDAKLKLDRIRNSVISLQQINYEYQKRQKLNYVYQPIITKFKERLRDYYEVKSLDYFKCSILTCFNLAACGVNSEKLFNFRLESPVTHSKFISIFKNSLFYNSNSTCAIFSHGNLAYEDDQNTVIFSPNSDLKMSRTLIVNSSFSRSNYRHNYDIVYLGYHGSVDVTKLNMMLPIKKKYLLSFLTYIDSIKQLPVLDQIVVGYLKNISDENQKSNRFSKIFFDTNCTVDVLYQNLSYPICYSHSKRVDSLSKSQFCLILSPWNSDLLTTKNELNRLLECLIIGSIPVILGDLVLPFEEVIDWSKAVIKMPKQAIADVIPTIEAVPESDIFQMKYYGRNFLISYFMNYTKQINTVALILTKRLSLNLPRPPNHSVDFLTFANHTSFYSFTLPTFPIEVDPYLGPNNIPSYDSPDYLSNMTRSQSHPLSDEKPGELRMFRFASTPWDPILPTDALLKGNSYERPFAINHSMNEAGVEFQQSLGGNIVYEQFTIVFLSHQKSSVLKKSLENVRGCPYVHSVVVVMNNADKDKLAAEKWPNLGVPLKIILARSNSLNNRFIPYDVIKTDAVLSFDDDMQLRLDEIVFAFRVWRENRDRIVGFPVRYHMNRDGKWVYNFDKTCEYSLVLTGAAFIHRFFYGVYTNHLYEVHGRVKQIVDDFSNCEDIAMNFLVSHITRKPPLKVTVRWNFPCMNCPDRFSEMDPILSTRLHDRPSHYTARSKCLNKFSRLYGYNPLLYSQYRADSVLFKTRVDAHNQKCFRYV